MYAELQMELETKEINYRQSSNVSRGKITAPSGQ